MRGPVMTIEEDRKNSYLNKPYEFDDIRFSTREPEHYMTEEERLRRENPHYRPASGLIDQRLNRSASMSANLFEPSRDDYFAKQDKQREAVTDYMTMYQDMAQSLFL